MEILHRNDLTLGGFAGLREHRLIVDPRVGWRNPGSWPGIGSCVYLADAIFQPHGETTMHPHREIDIISFIVGGRIAHDGTLGAGTILNTFDVQVQRGGAKGFVHNEINPDGEENRMLQMWVLPEKAGEETGYATFHPPEGATTRVYGGDGADGQVYASHTEVEVLRPTAGDTVRLEGPLLAYLALGAGAAGDEQLREGDLVRSDGLEFTAASDCFVISVSGR